MYHFCIYLRVYQFSDNTPQPNIHGQRGKHAPHASPQKVLWRAQTKEEIQEIGKKNNPEDHKEEQRENAESILQPGYKETYCTTESRLWKDIRTRWGEEMEGWDDDTCPARAQE